MAQFARPEQDVTRVNWTTNGGGTTNLYQTIDEVTPSDVDYVKSDLSPIISELYEAGLSDVSDPNSSSGHIIKIRARKSSTGGVVPDLWIELRQGATIKATLFVAETSLTTSFQEFTYTLSAAQANSITSYVDLRLRMYASNADSAATRAAWVSWAEFEVPNVNIILNTYRTVIVKGKNTLYSTRNITFSGTTPGFLYITRDLILKGQDKQYKVSNIIYKCNLTISGTVKNYDNSGISGATVKYISDITSQVNTDSNGQYQIITSSSGATIWTEWNNWHFDTEPPSSPLADFYSLSGLSSSPINKDFKIRNITDVDWYNRNFVGRYPITFASSHSAYRKDDVIEAVVSLGLHKKITDKGAYNFGVQEMQNAIVFTGNKTHIAFLGFNEAGNLTFSTIFKDELTEQWSSVTIVEDTGSSDFHYYPSMCADDDNYLYVAYRFHSGPGKFRKSKYPNDSTQWNNAQNIGYLGTYPRIFISSFGRIYLFLRVDVGGDDGRQVGYIYSDDKGSTWSEMQYIARTQTFDSSLYPFGITYYRKDRDPLKSLGATNDRILVVLSDREHYGTLYNFKHCIFAQADITNDENGTDNWRKANGTLYGTGDVSTIPSQAPIKDTNYEYVYQTTTNDWCIPMDVALDSAGRIITGYQVYIDSTNAYRGNVDGYVRKYSGGWQSPVHLYSKARGLGSSLFVDWNDYTYVINNTDMSGNVNLYISKDTASSFNIRTISENNKILGWRSLFRYDHTIKRVDSLISLGNDIYFLSFQPGVDFIGDMKNVHMVYGNTQIDRDIRGLRGASESLVYFKLQTAVPANKNTDLQKGYNLYVTNEVMSTAYNNPNNVYKLIENFEGINALEVHQDINGYNGWIANQSNSIFIDSHSTLGFDDHNKIYEGIQIAHMDYVNNVFAYKSVGTNLTNYLLKARIYRTAGLAYLMFKKENQQFRFGIFDYFQAGTATGWYEVDTDYPARINQSVLVRMYIGPYGVICWDERGSALPIYNEFNSFNEIGFGGAGNTKAFIDDIVLYPYKYIF